MKENRQAEARLPGRRARSTRLLDLPDDLIVQILSKVSKPDNTIILSSSRNVQPCPLSAIASTSRRIHHLMVTFVASNIIVRRSPPRSRLGLRESVSSQSNLPRLFNYPHGFQLDIGTPDKALQRRWIHHPNHRANLERILLPLQPAELTQVAQAMPNLARLDLAGCSGVTDTTLPRIAAITRLESLALSLCGAVTHDGLAVLSSLRSLRTLVLLAHKAPTRGGNAPLNDLFASLTALTSVCIDSSSALASAALTALPRLLAMEHLELTRCDVGGSGTSGAVAAFRPSAPCNLHRLRISYGINLTGTHVASLLCAMPRLDALELLNCSLLTVQDLAGLATLSALRRVSLEGCHCLKDPVFISPESGKGYGRLEEVDLTACSDVTDSTLAILGACPALRYLRMQGNKKISGEGITRVAAGGNGLLGLHLAYCVHLRDDAIGAICMAHTALQMLNLAGCTKLTNLSMEHIGKSLPSLTALDVSSSDISDNGMPPLAPLRHLATLRLRVTIGDMAIARIAEISKAPAWRSLASEKNRRSTEANDWLLDNAVWVDCW